ncbi:MAG TPA: hypothetical protein VG937_02175 [Polyangiaceae bacterium]|nr:hypothetical protein [Polyangiaceae bacterium]
MRAGLVVGTLACVVSACGGESGTSVAEESATSAAPLRRGHREHHHQPRKWRKGHHCPGENGGGTPECARKGSSWSRSFGTASQWQESTAIALDNGGAPVVAGVYGHQLAFDDFALGPVPWPFGAEANAFVAKFDACGQTVWARGTSNENDETQVAYAVASDSADNVLVAGSFSGTLDFGGSPITTSGADAFVTKFDKSGNVVWSQRFGAEEPEESAIALATDSESNVLLGVNSAQPMGIADGIYTGSVLKYDPNGNLIWARLIAAPYVRYSGNAAELSAVAVDQQGSVWATGVFLGTSLELDGTPILTSPDSIYGTPFLLKLDADGALVAATSLAPEGNIVSLAVDANDDALITGQRYREINDPTHGYVQLRDLFLSKFDVNGNALWQHVFADSIVAGDLTLNMLFPNALSTDADRNVVLTTDFYRGTVDLGGGPLTNDGDVDLLLTKFDASGNYLGSKQFGGDGPQQGIAVAIDPNGDAMLTGTFTTHIDFGQGPLPAYSDRDIFVAKVPLAE